jgi:hypothetical protein
MTVLSERPTEDIVPLLQNIPDARKKDTSVAGV